MLLNDVLLVAGAAFIIAGAYLVAGPGIALLVAGGFMLFAAVSVERVRG